MQLAEQLQQVFISETLEHCRSWVSLLQILRFPWNRHITCQPRHGRRNASRQSVSDAASTVTWQEAEFSPAALPKRAPGTARGVTAATGARRTVHSPCTLPGHRSSGGIGKWPGPQTCSQRTRSEGQAGNAATAGDVSPTPCKRGRRAGRPRHSSRVPAVRREARGSTPLERPGPAGKWRPQWNTRACHLPAPCIHDIRLPTCMC